jgi:hypothetical protein
MAAEGFKRELSAILSTDAVGYSRMMRDDEDETILTLTACRSAIADIVQKFRGRVVDATGGNSTVSAKKSVWRFSAIRNGRPKRKTHISAYPTTKVFAFSPVD